MTIRVRPAVLAWSGLILALLVGMRNPALGFRLLLVLAVIALVLRLAGGRRA